MEKKTVRLINPNNVLSLASVNPKKPVIKVVRLKGDKVEMDAQTAGMIATELEYLQAFYNVVQEKFPIPELPTRPRDESTNLSE